MRKNTSKKAAYEEEARSKIVRAFEKWIKDHNHTAPVDTTDAFVWFNSLEKEGSSLFDGVRNPNKWKSVKPWLIYAGLAKDKLV
jgi:hypothetical protein